MRPISIFASLSLVLVSAASTACEPFGNLDGDWTRGERGHTRWQIQDGLCPGLGGGCNLEVPIAVGAGVSLAVDGIEGTPVTASFTGGIEGDGGIDFAEDRDTLVPIRVVAAGPGRTELSDTHGAIDAATVFGREVTTLECGRWRQDVNLEWRMVGLLVSHEISLPMGSDDTFHLACRASDAQGPLLSADAIEWTIVSGSDSLDIASTDFGVFGASANGARIRYRTQAPGTVVVRASVGEISEDLTITVE